MKKILYILLFSCSIATSQTTYYISNSGNDSDDGLTTLTAWETLAKINSTTFDPGDSILFEKGGVWRDPVNIGGYGGMIYLTESGEEDNHITIASYGTGAKPRIFGSIAQDSWTAHPSYPNIYRLDSLVSHNPRNLPSWGSSAQPASCYFINNATDTIEWGDSNFVTIPELNNNYEWCYQNDSIYFYYDGSIGDIDSVEVTQQNGIFNLDGDYYTIDGIEWRYFHSWGVSSNPERNRIGLTIRNCRIAFSGGRGGIGYGVDAIFSDYLFEDNESYCNGRRNFSANLVNFSGTTIMRDVIIQNNYMHHGFHTTGFDIATQGINNGYKNITVRNNTIYENPGISIPPYEFRTVGTFFESNAGAANWDSIYVYNNEFLNFGYTNLLLYGIGTSWVINNTFVGAPYDAIGTLGFIGINGTNSITTIMNNIFFLDNTSFIGWGSIYAVGDGNDITYDSVDHNFVYIGNNANHYLISPPNPPFTQTTYDQDEWSEIRSFGWEVNGLTPPQYPHFADSLESGELKSTSPAIGTAAPISFITTDINGNPRDATNPDAGAWEFQGIDSTATKILTFTITSQVSSVVTSADSSVAIVMPYGTDVTDLTPTITLSTGATVSPLSGVSNDFTTPKAYTVTSLKSNTQEWTVTVTVQAVPVEPVFISMLYDGIQLYGGVTLMDGVPIIEAPVNIKNSTIPISGGKARINSEGKIILYNTN